MAIQFDETNLLTSVVGDGNGITREELAAAAPAAQAALKSFQVSWKQGLYGFPDLPSDSKIVNQILRFAAEVKGTYDTVCLVGIGGSALGAWALDCGLRGPHPIQTAKPRLVILDNVDPVFVTSAIESMNPKKTLVVVIAKSGATAESVSVFLIVEAWLRRRR